MKTKALVFVLAMVTARVASAQVAPAQTILCNQGGWNLYMQMEYEQIRSAVLGLGEDERESVAPIDITYSGGSAAYIRTDVEYDANGAFSNCHAL